MDLIPNMGPNDWEKSPREQILDPLRTLTAFDFTVIFDSSFEM